MENPQSISSKKTEDMNAYLFVVQKGSEIYIKLTNTQTLKIRKIIVKETMTFDQVVELLSQGFKDRIAFFEVIKKITM